MAASRRDRVRPLEAIRALRALIDDPDDTSQVFRVIRALSGRNFERLFHRVRKDPVGGPILAEGRILLDTTSDRERLRRLPKDSLGHTYARFMDEEQITAEGLLDASTSDETYEASPLGPEAEVLGERLRDMHDLWRHVVSGYNRDLLGEAALLAFTYAQTRNRGIGVIVAVALWKLWRGGAGEAVELIKGGYRRGRQAALLPAADWQRLMGLPLDQVRRELRVEPAPDYTQQRSDGAPPLAEPGLA